MLDLEGKFEKISRNLKYVIKKIENNKPSEIDEKTKNIIEAVDKEVEIFVDYFLSQSEEIFGDEIKAKLNGKFKDSPEFHLNFYKYFYTLCDVKSEVLGEVENLGNTQFPVSYLDDPIFKKSHESLLKLTPDDPEMRNLISLLPPYMLNHYMKKNRESVNKMKSEIKDFISEDLPQKVQDKELIKKLIDPKSGIIRKKGELSIEWKGREDKVEVDIPHIVEADLPRFEYLSYNGKRLHDQNDSHIKVENSTQLKQVCKTVVEDLGEKDFKNIFRLLNQYLPTQGMMIFLQNNLEGKYSSFIRAKEHTPSCVDIKKEGSQIEGEMKAIAIIVNKTYNAQNPSILNYLVWQVKVDFPENTAKFEELPIFFHTASTKKEEKKSTKSSSEKSDQSALNITWNLKSFDSLKEAEAYLKII